MDVVAVENDPREKLSLRVKLAYGLGDLGTAIVGALKAFFLLFFLTDVARMDPAAAGSILLLTKIWDAVNDPIVGWLSDRTNTRWGRRRPWLLFGALPFGLLLFMLWLVPPFGPLGTWLYYLVVGLLLDAVYTVINVPYTALTPELTRDYDERTSLNSFRAGVSIIGSVLAAGLHPVIVGQFDDPRTGYMVSAAIWGVLVTLPPLLVFAIVRERPETLEEQQRVVHMPFRDQIKVAFGNRPYRFVVTLYLFSWLALQLTATVMAYYMTYYMGRPGWLPVVLVSIQLSSFAFVFVWSALSRRLDKRMVYLIGATIWLVVQMGLYLLPPGQIAMLIPLAILSGVGVSTAYLIPWSMMPDVIEFDEWETGERREGIFYGFMVFLQKSGIAVAIWFVGVALAWSGYITPTDAVPQPVQPEGALNAIRMFVGPVPAAILALSLVVAYFYPISRTLHAEMRASLARRRAAADSTAPLDAPTQQPATQPVI
jgi:GPH family glycoside/pentoside/hexuronide:cation symporter